MVAQLAGSVLRGRAGDQQKVQTPPYSTPRHGRQQQHPQHLLSHLPAAEASAVRERAAEPGGLQRGREEEGPAASQQVSAGACDAGVQRGQRLRQGARQGLRHPAGRSASRGQDARGLGVLPREGGWKQGVLAGGVPEPVHLLQPAVRAEGVRLAEDGVQAVSELGLRVRLVTSLARHVTSMTSCHQLTGTVAKPCLNSLGSRFETEQ